MMLCCLMLLLLTLLLTSCRFFAPSEVSEPVLAPTSSVFEETPIPVTTPSLLPLETTPTPSPRPTSRSDYETVTLWHSLSPDSPEGQALSESLARFEQEYPQIVILDRYRGTDTQLSEILYEAVTNLNMPDVVITSSGTMAELAKSDALVSLDGFLNWEQDEETEFEHILSSLGSCYGCDAGIYSLPYMIDSIGLWYNPEILDGLGIEKVPTTWQEFSMTCQYMSSSLGSPALLLVPDGRVALALVLSSGEIPTAESPFFELGENTSSVLETIQNLAWANSILLEMDQENALNLFLNGEIPFCISGTDFLSSDELAASQIEIAPLPQLNASEATSLVYGWHIGISKDASESREPSWTLVQYLTSTQEAAEIAQTSGHPPVSHLALSLVGTDVAQEQMLYSKANVFYDSEPLGESIIGIDGIKAVLSQVLVDITSGSYVPNEALKLARSNILRLIAYYGVTP